MKEFSVCYDKFCMGRFSLVFDEEENVIPFEGMGEFEMYLLSMWSDGMVVTMKGYDETREENHFILLLPDGSEQVMYYSPDGGFAVQQYRGEGAGRFAYLLDFRKGMEYKGYRGYEEYDAEDKIIIGVVTVGDQTITYGGQNIQEVRADFERQIDRMNSAVDG